MGTIPIFARLNITTMSVQRSAALKFILITILIDVIGFGIIIPVLPSLLEEITGAGLAKSASYNSWLLFAYAGMQFLFSPLLGALSDKYGRRPVLLFSLLGLGIDYIFQAFSPTLVLLFIGRLIAGMAGASFTTATAYIADISTPEKRAQNFGMVGAAFGLGFIVGPALGGLFSKLGTTMGMAGGINWHLRLPFIAAAIFSLLNVLYGFFVLPESLDKEKRRNIDPKKVNPVSALKHLGRYPVISGLVLSNFLLYLASHAVQSNWAFYTKYKFSWDEGMIGYSLSVVGLLVGLVQGGLIRYTMPKLGEKNSVFIGFGLYAVAMLLFAFAGQGWMMFAILIPYCLGGISGPALQGIISNQVPDNEQGELQGALTSLVSLTSIIGPLIMNNLFAAFTGKNAPFIFPGMPFIAGAMLIVGSIITAAPSLRHFHRTKNEPMAE